MPELAKYVRHYDFVVSQDGSCDFFTVQEAINAVPDFRKKVRTTILVRKGVYKEKLIVPESKINISLIGQEGAVISYDKERFGPNTLISIHVEPIETEKLSSSDSEKDKNIW